MTQPSKRIETPEWTEQEIELARLAEIKIFGKVMFD